MVHQRQRLSLGFESSDYLTRVHPEPDHFERHLPVDRFVLLGQIDHSPSALAELAQQFVAADSGPQSILRAQINGVSLFWMVRKPPADSWALINSSTSRRNDSTPPHARSRKALRCAESSNSNASSKMARTVLLVLGIGTATRSCVKQHSGVGSRGITMPARTSNADAQSAPARRVRAPPLDWSIPRKNATSRTGQLL